MSEQFTVFVEGNNVGSSTVSAQDAWNKGINYLINSTTYKRGQTSVVVKRSDGTTAMSSTR